MYFFSHIIQENRRTEKIVNERKWQSVFLQGFLDAGCRRRKVNKMYLTSEKSYAIHDGVDSKNRLSNMLAAI